MWPHCYIDRSAGVTSTSGRTAAGQQWNAAGVRASCRRIAVQTHASQPHKKSSNQQKLSSRNAQLYELCGDDGWGVEVAPAATSSKMAPSQKAAAAPAAQKLAVQQPPVKKARRKGTPYVDMRSQEGIFGMTLLQKALLEQEEQQQQQSQESSDSSSIQALKDSMALTAPKSSKKPKLPGFPSGGQAAAALAKQQQQQLPYAYEDDEDDEEEATPEFEITFDQGKTEFVDYTTGTTRSSATSEDGSELDDFELSGWDQFDGLEEQQREEEDEEEQLMAVSKKKRRQAAAVEEDADLGASLLMDLSNEDDWGLEGLSPNMLPRGGQSMQQQQQQHQQHRRRSLLDEIAAAEDEADGFEEGSLAASGTSSVQWGGSAGTTGIDLEEQEELLRRYFRPDQVKKLMQDQVEIDASYSEMRKRAVGLGVSDHKTQEKLRIVAGTAAGRKLISFRSTQTRPMMEKVRQAIFNMIQSQAGTINSLPKAARWLDLFAGTGSVGLEALSRGVREAHFVEMDPVVVQKILSRNIASCGFKGRATCHTTKAEDFLRRAGQLPRFAGGPFDFISVCPPYLLVSYPELYDLLEESPLIHPGSIVFVEYPKQLAHQVRDTMGPLQKVKSRKYGRTYVAVYAGGSDNSVEEEELDDPFLAREL